MSTDLKSATLMALSGSDLVKERLLHALYLGPRAIGNSPNIYAIKCRVKSSESLRKKVLDRRKKTESLSYSPSDATDIIGLRILVLFSEHLSMAVLETIRFIEFLQSDDVSILIPGDNIGATIKEIIIYSSARRTIYYAIHDWLIQRYANEKDLLPKINFRESSREKPYSSIHLVCLAINPVDNAERPIPIEIQLRTAFEDIWGEIEHPRKYKSPISNQTQDEDDVASHFSSSIQNQLNQLKANLESCSDDADQIKKDFDFLIKRQKSSNSIENKRLPNKGRYSNHTPPDIKKQIDSIETALESFYSKHDSAVTVESELFDSELNSLNTLLDDLLKSYKHHSPNCLDIDNSFFYFYSMEKAFLLYRRAISL